MLNFLCEVSCSLCCTDADVRLARRIMRDTLERGRDVNGVIEQVRFRVLGSFLN